MGCGKQAECASVCGGSPRLDAAYLLVEGLREEERVGTGMQRPLDSTSASLFERGTVFTAEQERKEARGHSLQNGTRSQGSAAHNTRHTLDASLLDGLHRPEGRIRDSPSRRYPKGLGPSSGRAGDIRNHFLSLAHSK